MSQANFNLVLHPEARFAAEDFHNRLKIPFIELRRLYQMDKIENQYRALGQVLGVAFDQEQYKDCLLYTSSTQKSGCVLKNKQNQSGYTNKMHKKMSRYEYKLHIHTVDFKMLYVIISLVKRCV